MRTRIFTTALAALLVLTTAPPALAAHDVSLKTKKTAPMVAGGTAWLAITWQGGDSLATDFRVAITDLPAGVLVSYPGVTDRGFTMLHQNASLSQNELDLVRIRLFVPYGQPDFSMTANATYQQDGATVTGTWSIEVPVIAGKEKVDLTQTTTSLGSVPADCVDTECWVGVSYAGMAPSLNDFSVEVTDAAGLSITYPNSALSTSLFWDNVLENGETDTARFRVDTTGTTPGPVNLTIKASYDKAGSTKTLEGTVTLDITG